MSDLIDRQMAIDIIHQTICLFFDVCEDDEEVPIGDNDKLLLKVNKAICNKIRSLTSANQWIPVTERLPEKDGRYLVTWLCLNRKSVTVAWHGKAWWREDDEPRFYASEGEFGNILLRDVTAWMPLPEPYEEDKE